MTSPAPLAERVLAGERRAIGRALSVVDGDGAETLVDALYAHTGRAWRLGVTGPPGAGKSTLVDRLVGVYRARGERVAVVAVDPSSPFTGGALLGDRVRMDARAAGPDGRGDDGVFVRSLAARGAGGGLADAAEASADVFDAAGFGVVIVETVGVGQGELDVAEAADTVLVVLVPEAGDGVQAMKAGLMEIADVFCVNKADKPEAGALVRALRAALHLRPPPDPTGAPTPTVVSASALHETGLDKLITALDAHRASLPDAADRQAARLRRRVRTLVEAAWRRRFWTPARVAALDGAIASFDASEHAPHRLAAQIASGLDTPPATTA